MSEKRFNPKKLHKLNDPRRLHDLPPDFLWEKAGLAAAEIRCLPAEVKNDVERAGFRNGVVHEELAKHFLLIAER